MTPGYEKYYRYRYMAVEEQVGHDEGAKAKDDDDDDSQTNPKEGVKSGDDSDDSQMADEDDDDSSDDMADDDSSESGAFTEAMLTIASQMADEWTGNYGMKILGCRAVVGRESIANQRSGRVAITESSRGFQPSD